MRQFNYLEDYNKIYQVKSILLSTKELLTGFLLNDELKESADIYKYLRFIDELNEDLSVNNYSSIILNDLLSADNVEYQMKNGHHKKDCSKIGTELDIKINTAFEIEEIVRQIIANKWNRSISNFNNFKNGDEFGFVFHSGHSIREISLKGTNDYCDNDYFNTSYISCSYLNNHHMEVYNDNIGLVFDVDGNNFLGSSDTDCATVIQSHRDVSSIKQIGDKFVKIARFDKKNVLMTPDQIINNNVKDCIEKNNEQLNNDNINIYNEIVLDKETSTPIGIALLSDGLDLLVQEYATAIHMKKMYDLNIKVINKSVYRTNLGLEPYTKKSLDNHFFKMDLPYSNFEHIFNNIDMDEFINSYDRDVLIGGNYDDNIRIKILNKLNEFKLEKEEANRRAI